MDVKKRMIIDPCDKNGEPLDVGMDVFTDDGHMSSIESFQWDGKEWCAVLEPFATYNPDGSVDTFIRSSYKTSELTVKPKLVVEPEEDMDDEDVDDEDVGKRITAQMREYLAESKPMGGWGALHFEHLIKMCDAIDETHEKQCESEYAAGVMSVPIAVDESKWVKLPVDADGVPIRVGDVVESSDGDVFTVESIDLFAFGWKCCGDGIDKDGYKCTSYQFPNSCHHHASTVEDVLQEILFKAHIYDEREMELLPDLIAEYASRLRLAGDV